MYTNIVSIGSMRFALIIIIIIFNMWGKKRKQTNKIEKKIIVANEKKNCMYASIYETEVNANLNFLTMYWW